MRVVLDRRGPPGHGVVRHACQLAGLLEQQGVSVVRGGVADLTHVQFTDSLWGHDIVAAADAYRAWAEQARRPIVVTLHDVPGADPDRSRDQRRSTGYARVLSASDDVIVCSQHEGDKVVQLGGRRPRFIELPLARLAGARPGPEPVWAGGAPSLGVLGFVYPGKGHGEMIDAAARSRTPMRVVALGAVSPGHDALRRHLDDRAGGQDVEMIVTGDLTDRALRAAASAVTVPVAPNGPASASSSLLAWLGCRRRPLAADGPFSREIDARHPGLVARYRSPSELDDLIGLSLQDPVRTRLDGVPPWPDIGLAHIEMYQDVLRPGGRLDDR